MPRTTRSVLTCLLALAGCGGGGFAMYESTTATAEVSGGSMAIAPGPPATEAGDMSGERYQAAEEGQLIPTAQDTRVTFSLDVDTASYTLTRRDLNAGRLPHPDG